MPNKPWSSTLAIQDQTLNMAWRFETRGALPRRKGFLYGPSNWILFNANLMKAFSVSLYGNEPVAAGVEIVIHAL